MPPTTHLDSLIAAAKRELDAARLDGDATRIATAMTMLNGRLDRRLSESGRMRPQPADVRDPEGLCNTYHQAAVGQPPGKGH